MLDDPNKPSKFTPPKPSPPQLPNNIEDWHRQLKAERNLNDMVEDIHRFLVADKQYIAYLYAVYDEQAVEGSLGADNVFAAQMIRERASKMGGVYDEVAKQKAATIVKALGVVLRRYNASRKQRRLTVGGEIVPPERDQNNGD